MALYERKVTYMFDELKLKFFIFMTELSMKITEGCHKKERYYFKKLYGHEYFEK
jgi:hypothetical protein